MALLGIVVWLVLVVGLMLAAAFAVCVGRERLDRIRVHSRDRFVPVLPSFVVLGAVLVLNSFTRQITEQVSWLVGLNISGLIFRIEGGTVGEVQRIAMPELTAYFSFAYVFGYVFLLVFPLVAYLLLDRLTTLNRLTLAYTVNYSVGLLCYLLFVSYGPRNFDVANELLYDVYPRVKFLTTAINVNTNVFPSLHTSLSVTVMLFAWRTRDTYPRWLPIAAVLGTSVVFATVYLGIHWVVDVIAGIALGYVSYLVGIRWADRWDRLLALEGVSSIAHRPRF